MREFTVNDMTLREQKCNDEPARYHMHVQDGALDDRHQVERVYWSFIGQVERVYDRSYVCWRIMGDGAKGSTGKPKVWRTREIAAGKLLERWDPQLEAEIAKAVLEVERFSADIVHLNNALVIFNTWASTDYSPDFFAVCTVVRRQLEVATTKVAHLEGRRR